MSAGDSRPELVKTASLNLPPEIVGSPDDAEKHTVSGGGGSGIPAEGEAGISYKRLVTIMIGLCLTIFLTALDQVLTLQKGEINSRRLFQRRCRRLLRIWVIPPGIPG